MHLRRKVTRLTATSAITASTTGWTRGDRRLTPQQAWQLYWTTPDVRACVDQIVRRVATWDWYLNVDGVQKGTPKHNRATEEANQATRFMKNPTVDGLAWQELMTIVLTDLLVHDSGAAELVTKGTTLKEMAWLNGGFTFPVVDTYGRRVGYFYSAEGVYTASDPNFKLDEVLYLQLFPNSKSAEGIPLIETLLNEVVAMLTSSERVVITLDADEIPPGLLVLGGLAKEAVAAAKMDAENMRGQDHKLRVMYGQGVVDARWIELRHPIKDIQMKDLVDQVRRTIWRVFGASPIEMGETQNVPRASAEVQVDVSSSHLITPILETVAAKINARVLPYLISEEMRQYVSFQFDLEAKLSPEERTARSQDHDRQVKQGILTRNEARTELGYDPIEGGDVATIEEGNALVPVAAMIRRLADALKEPEPEPVPVVPPAPVVEDEEEPSVDLPEPEEQEETDAAPGEAEGDETGEEGEEGRSCGCGCGMGHRAVGGLPSDWPSASLFKGYRTLPLAKLAEEVSGYDSDVAGLWKDAQRSVLARLSGLDLGNALDLARGQAAIREEVAALLSRWSTATQMRYRAATELARDAAREYTGAQVLEGWRERADVYHARAMGYLDDPDGLLTALSVRLNGALTEAGQAAKQTRALDQAALGADAVDEAIAAGVGAGDALLMAAGGAFDALEARTVNWGGKLVELASESFRDGLMEVGSSVEWWCEWVAVGDQAMCAECEMEGAAGFRPLASLTFVPGSGSTSCGAKCRCVLVVWTRQEVIDGTAVRLTGVGNPL